MAAWAGQGPQARPEAGRWPQAAKAGQAPGPGFQRFQHFQRRERCSGAPLSPSLGFPADDVLAQPTGSCLGKGAGWGSASGWVPLSAATPVASAQVVVVVQAPGLVRYATRGRCSLVQPSQPTRGIMKLAGGASPAFYFISLRGSSITGRDGARRRGVLRWGGPLTRGAGVAASRRVASRPDRFRDEVTTGERTPASSVHVGGVSVRRPGRNATHRTAPHRTAVTSALPAPRPPSGFDPIPA